MLSAALLSLIAWVVLLTAWGGFWRANQRLPASSPMPSSAASPSSR